MLTFVLFAATIFFDNPVIAQLRTWGKLQIPVSDGWSAKQKAGSVQLSNYNLANAEPFTITLFDNEPFKGKPDTLFAFAWKKYMIDPPQAPDIPRWRRFYTNDGLLIQQGFVEFTKEGGPLFRQLNVFMLDNSFQVCLLETTSSKNYRLMQTEWMEKLQGVKLVSGTSK